MPFAYLDGATLPELQQAALQLGFAASQLAALNSGIQARSSPRPCRAARPWPG